MKDFDVIRKLLDDMEAELEKGRHHDEYERKAHKWADETGKDPDDYWQYSPDEYDRPMRPFVVKRLGVTARALIKQLYDCGEGAEWEQQ